MAPAKASPSKLTRFVQSKLTNSEHQAWLKCKRELARLVRGLEDISDLRRKYGQHSHFDLTRACARRGRAEGRERSGELRVRAGSQVPTGEGGVMTYENWACPICDARGDCIECSGLGTAEGYYNTQDLHQYAIRNEDGTAARVLENIATLPELRDRSWLVAKMIQGALRMSRMEGASHGV